MAEPRKRAAKKVVVPDAVIPAPKKATAPVAVKVRRGAAQLSAERAVALRQGALVARDGERLGTGSTTTLYTPWWLAEFDSGVGGVAPILSIGTAVANASVAAVQAAFAVAYAGQSLPLVSQSNGPPTSGTVSIPQVAAMIGAQATADAAAYEALRNSRMGRKKGLPLQVNVNPVMASPPTVGALSTSSAITSGRTFTPITEASTLYALNSAKYFAYSQGGLIDRYGSVSPDYQYVASSSITAVAAAKMPSWAIEWVYDGAGAMEIRLKGIASTYRIWVDGQLVSATPGIVTNTGSVYFLPVTFSGRGQHRIRFETTGVFGGVVIGPNDSLWAPEIRGPRVIVVGDSYTAGTGALSACSNFVRTIAAAMGWSDVWSSGVGGTGYLNAGSGGTVTFRSRLTADVLNFNPDIIIWAGGHNDTGSTPSALQTEVGLCLAQAAAALPNVIQIVFGIMWNSGAEALTPAVIDCDAAIAAAAAAAGLSFIPFLTGPTTSAAVPTTLSAPTAINATTISIPVPVAIQSTIEIDTATLRERRVITNLVGGGPFTATLNAGLLSAHASGASVTPVGANFWTGTGHVGATTGVGNCDVLVSADATHPTQEGHDTLGLYAAQKIADIVLAA